MILYCIHMMWFSKLMVFISMTIVYCSLGFISGLDCGSNVTNTITVDKLGSGKFSTIQGAIDSIPSYNDRWIRVLVKPGIYIEQVRILEEKPCILLEGVSSKLTTIQYDAHNATDTSPTFTVWAENFVAKNIAFKNSYNLGPPSDQHQRTPAVAALIAGDKATFFQCGFLGVQDTLWDYRGRHYFNSCYIEGVVDFIFGGGQSIYEGCTLNVISVPDLNQTIGQGGYITAQSRASPDDPSGFVFKKAAVVGTGLARLGRAYGPYSRVIFGRSLLTKVVIPQGWDAWNYVGHEENFMYAECSCFGEGSDTSKRVTWEKKIDLNQLRKFTQLSFIDQEGWIEKQP